MNPLRWEEIMTKSVLRKKRILAVDDEPDVLAELEDEILLVCPDCTLEKAINYEGAAKLLNSKEYDIVILDIMGVRGFDLLEIAVSRNFKVVMLTAHALNHEALQKSHDLGARAYLPKEKLAEIVPFLEDVLNYDHKAGWRRLLDKLENYFDERFEKGWKDKTRIPY